MSELLIALALICQENRSTASAPSYQMKCVAKLLKCMPNEVNAGDRIMIKNKSQVIECLEAKK